MNQTTFFLSSFVLAETLQTLIVFSSLSWYQGLVSGKQRCVFVSSLCFFLFKPSVIKPLCSSRRNQEGRKNLLFQVFFTYRPYGAERGHCKGRRITLAYGRNTTHSNCHLVGRRITETHSVLKFIMVSELGFW